MPPEPPPDSPKRSPSRRLAAPLLLCAVAGLIAFAALLRGTRGEAEARRSLALRADELVAWLDHDVAVACERDTLASDPGPQTSAPWSDAAPAWRDVLAACDQAAAISLAPAPRLPALDADPDLKSSLNAAIGARRFVPFALVVEIVEDPWPRRARVFARLLANGFSMNAPRADRFAWLEGAVALASDLRAVGTLDHGAVAAEIDEAIAVRLGAEPLAPDDAARLAGRVERARDRLPPAACVAERETRLLQATVCALADVAPLRGGRLRADDEPPLPLPQADAAVARLDRLPELLLPLLCEDQGQGEAAARRALAQWRDAFGRELPRVALLLPASEAIAANAGASGRLDRLLEVLRRKAGGRG